MIPFHRSDLGVDERLAVQRVIESGWLTSGSEMRMFEQEVGKWVDPIVQPECVAVSSATMGLLLSLVSLGLKGGEVVVPTITFVACAEVVSQAGGSLVLCDVSSESQNMSLSSLQSVVTTRTKAVILVHFAGKVGEDYERIVKFCSDCGIAIIEDAAHAFGSQYVGGQRVGSANTYATVYSFYATKCITTGEGGMVCTRSGEVANKIRVLRLHGITHDVFDRYTSKTPQWEYDVGFVGFKGNLSDLAAAIGRVQLRKESEMRKRRQVIAAVYDELLPARVCRPAGGWGHCRHLYPVQVSGIDRNCFIDYMFAHGVAVSVHFKPIHLFNAYAGGSFPVAERYWMGAVSLPLFNLMTPEDVQRVVAVVKAAYE